MLFYPLRLALPIFLHRHSLSTILDQGQDQNDRHEHHRPRTIAKDIVLSKLSTMTMTIATRESGTLPKIANKFSNALMIAFRSFDFRFVR